MRWTSKGLAECGRIARTTSGPIVMFGTKCPSITSTWIQSPPAWSTARTSSPSRAKSAERIEGAMRRGRVMGRGVTRGARTRQPAGRGQYVRLGRGNRPDPARQRLHDLRHEVDRELRQREEQEGGVRRCGPKRGDEEAHIPLAGAVAQHEAVGRGQGPQEQGRGDEAADRDRKSVV